jgi:hypothetical protein
VSQPDKGKLPPPAQGVDPVLDARLYVAVHVLHVAGVPRPLGVAGALDRLLVRADLGRERDLGQFFQPSTSIRSQ